VGPPYTQRYDLIEWDVPDPERQGVAFPLAGEGTQVANAFQEAAQQQQDTGGGGMDGMGMGGGMGGMGGTMGMPNQIPSSRPTPSSSQASSSSSSSSVDPASLAMLTSQGVPEPLAVQALKAVAPRNGSMDDALMWVFTEGQQQGEGAAAMTDDQDTGTAEGAAAAAPLPFVEFEGVKFNRIVDCYSDEEWSEPSEAWAIELLKPVVRALFREDKDDKLKYDLLLPELPPSSATSDGSAGAESTSTRSVAASITDGKATSGKRVVRLLGCDKAGEECATWKEIVLSEEWSTVQAFNLLSHGRRACRAQCFASDARLSLASLNLVGLGSSREPQPPVLARQAGSWKDVRQAEGSLVVTRFGGDQLLVPGRLLAGVVPAALLESYRFWQKSPPRSSSNSSSSSVGGANASSSATSAHLAAAAASSSLVPALVGEPLDPHDPFFGDKLLLWPAETAPQAVIAAAAAAGAGTATLNSALGLGTLLIQRVGARPSSSSRSSRKTKALAAATAEREGAEEEEASTPRSPSSASMDSPPRKGPALLRVRSIGHGEGGSGGDAAEEPIDEALVAQLGALGVSATAAKLALRAVMTSSPPSSTSMTSPTSTSGTRPRRAPVALLGEAMDWLSKPANVEVVELAEAMAMSMDQDEGSGEGGGAFTAADFEEAATADSASLMTDQDAAISSSSSSSSQELPSLMSKAHPAWSSSPSSSSSRSGKSSSDRGRPKLVLLNLLHTAPDPPSSEHSNEGLPCGLLGGALHRLALLLSRMEDLSHVLVWAKATATANEEEEQPQEGEDSHISSSSSSTQALVAHVELIELPRLKLRLKPVVSRDGATVKLELLDHAGWFVSDRFSSSATAGITGAGAGAGAVDVTGAAAMTLEANQDEMKYDDGDEDGMGSASLRWLPTLLHGLGEALVVESEGEGLQLLVPNHDLHRPQVGWHYNRLKFALPVTRRKVSVRISLS